MCALHASVFECGGWHLLDMAEVRARLRSFSSILIRDCRSMRGFVRDESFENGLAGGLGLDCVGGGSCCCWRGGRGAANSSFFKPWCVLCVCVASQPSSRLQSSTATAAAE
jgi:hypothetical protein